MGRAIALRTTLCSRKWRTASRPGGGSYSWRSRGDGDTNPGRRYKPRIHGTRRQNTIRWRADWLSSSIRIRLAVQSVVCSRRHAVTAEEGEARNECDALRGSAALAAWLALCSLSPIGGVARAPSGARPGAARRTPARAADTPRRRPAAPGCAWRLDQPELLGLAGELEQTDGHLRLDVGVGLAVDHQQRPRSQPRQMPSPGAGSGSAVRARSAAGPPGRSARNTTAGSGPGPR